MKIRNFLPLFVFLIGICTPLQAAEVIGVTSQLIKLETNKGVLVRLKRDAGTVFVANPDIADVQVKTPRLIYLTAKKPGETTLYVLDERERVLVNQPVHVRHNLSRINATIRDVFPGADVHLRSMGSTLILSGTVENASHATDLKTLAERFAGKNIINQIGVTKPHQVHLRVKVAEVSRTVLKQFGVDLAAALDTPNGIAAINSGSPFITAPFTFLDPNLPKQFLADLPNTNTSLFSFNNGRVDVNALLDALDSEGLITILAEPNLTAVSGENATFLAGGEFPIVIPDDKGRAIVSFKTFGVSLNFTPTVVNGDTISLKVKPEVSQLSSAGAIEISGFSIPALTTRRTETTVELGSGQSFAIAGILQNNISRSLERYPGLAELPILGALFRSDRFEREETELVIIVTPYLVRPVSAGKLAVPTDGFTAPTDTDRIVHNRLYRPSANRGRKSPETKGLRGPAGASGFVLD